MVMYGNKRWALLKVFGFHHSIRFLQKGILNKWKLVELKSGTAPYAIDMNDLDLKLKKVTLNFNHWI